MLRTLLTSSFVLFALLFSSPAQAQNDDLLGLLDSIETEEPAVIDYTPATFKTTRVITSRSSQLPARGEMQFLIAHRFGRLNSGWRDFFGLDQANIRFEFEYGITDWLSVGWGRSNIFKMWDGYARANVLRQSTGKLRMPITLQLLTSVSMTSGPWREPERKNYISSRASYVFQMIIARKITRNLSLQLMPTMLHKNLVTSSADKNDLFMFGAGGRYLLSGSFSINMEYHYLLPDRIVSPIDVPKTDHSFSIGFDLETGGHVFQVMATNNLGMTEHQYFTSATTGKWLDGDIHIGFNVNRVFTLADHEKMKKKKEARRLKKDSQGK
jgi:hypothetical protein